MRRLCGRLWGMANPSSSAPPLPTLKDLRKSIRTAAEQRGAPEKITQSLVANVIVGQMLPGSAVKGGTMLKLRFGDSVTRQTPDLDTAFAGNLEQFIADLETALLTGWNGFTGRLVVGDKRAPESVPFQYVMQPIAVKLQYLGKSWWTVDLEVGHDEFGATMDQPLEHVLAQDIEDLFVELGLPTPAGIPVLPLHHQIAQKLHACSEPGGERAHDLVDLQLMADEADDQLVVDAARWLFRFRKQHSWPPTFEVGTRWSELYAQARGGVAKSSAHADVKGAATWVNEYVVRLDALP